MIQRRFASSPQIRASWDSQRLDLDPEEEDARVVPRRVEEDPEVEDQTEEPPLMEEGIQDVESDDCEDEQRENGKLDHSSEAPKCTIRGVPKRPQRKVGHAARTQRFVLHGPGQVHVADASKASKPAAVFMTHLPDSPPRIYGSSGRGTIFKFSSSALSSSTECLSIRGVEAEEKKTNVLEETEAKVGSLEELTGDKVPQEEEKSLSVLNVPAAEADAEEEEGDEEEEEEEEGDQRSSAEQRPEVDESTEDVGGSSVSESDATSFGPHALDIADDITVGDLHGPRVADSEKDQEEEEEEEEEEDSDDDRDEEEFKAMQAGHARFEAEQRERDTLRRELESHVSSLTAMRDDQGDKLIEFPTNFQQIVALMTKRDLTSEDSSATTGKHGKPPPPSSSAADRHKSWSQVLIQNSLAKQQAYGTLDESEDGGDGAESNSLATKIALKMARIRQLDLILEEKLGKNLYSNATTTTTIKKKTTTTTTAIKTVNPQEPQHSGGSSSSSSSSSRRKPPVVQATTSSMPTRGDVVGGATSQLNHVERNKLVVENGAKAKLTWGEEQRLKKLLRKPKATPMTARETEMPNRGEDLIATAEFKLDPQQNDEIEKLLAEKRGVYQSAVVMALDDAEEEKRDQDGEVAGKDRKRNNSIVQDAKRERLRRQRLLRIEEELQFLHANASVSILPDNDNENDEQDDDASDGCMSERSYVTTTSMRSTCSTRSGVTRRQLDHFVATEIRKPECTSGAKASHDEIQLLLRSLSHVNVLHRVDTARSTTTSG